MKRFGNMKISASKCPTFLTANRKRLLTTINNELK